MLQFDNLNSKMGTETILKNEVSPKSLMSRKNFITVIFGIFFTVFIFSGCCSKEDPIVTVDITYHWEGSEDLISVYDLTITFPTPHGRIEENNIQLPWSKTIKGVPLPVSDSIEWKCTPKSDYPQKDNYIVDIDIYVTLNGGEITRHPARYTIYDVKGIIPLQGTCRYSISFDE